MNKMKKIIIMMILMLTVTGCNQAVDTVDDQTQTNVAPSNELDSSFYSIVDFGASNIRTSYYTSFYSTVDFVKIGNGLQRLSSRVFSTDSYYLADGNLLTSDDLTALLRRSSDPEEYPHTLQPQRGTTIEGVANPIMVSTIYEQDFYQKSGGDFNLAGASFAIVVDPRDENNNRLDSQMTSTTIHDYSREIIPTMYEYVKSLEDFKDVPVNIYVYLATDTSVNDYNGGYILKSVEESGGIGTIEEVDDITVLFASTAASELDYNLNDAFSLFKKEIKDKAYEAVGIIGEGTYSSNSLVKFTIDVNINVKTYTEMIYLVSTAKEAADDYLLDYPVTIMVSSQDEQIAVINKAANKSGEAIMLV